MTRLYYEALKALPDEYVDGDTRVTELAGLVIAVNPRHMPILYEHGVWVPLTSLHKPVPS